MIDRKKVNNVLKRVFAAKTEKVPKEEPQEYPSEEKTAQESSKGKPVSRKRYYFFDANPGNAIQFNGMKQILKQNTPEKEALIKKLQGGNTALYSADYFRWLKVCVVTDEFHNMNIVYECDLNPFGTKMGEGKVSPAIAPVTPEAVEKSISLFRSDKLGLANLVNFDVSEESFYVQGEVPNNIDKILLSRTTPPGKIMDYKTFDDYKKSYRVWVYSLNKLLYPNLDQPDGDDFDNKYYPGGKDAFEKIMKETGNTVGDVKDKPESLGEKINKPVDDQEEEGISHEKGKFLDKSASEKEKKKSKGDYSSEPYSGGTDVMQKLVRDQSKNMDIRRASRNVLAMYMEAAYSGATPATQSTPPSSTSTSGNPTVTITQDPKDTKRKSDALKNLSKAQEDAAKKLEQMNKDVSKF